MKGVNEIIGYLIVLAIMITTAGFIVSYAIQMSHNTRLQRPAPEIVLCHGFLAIYIPTYTGTVYVEKIVAPGVASVTVNTELGPGQMYTHSFNTPPDYVIIYMRVDGGEKILMVKNECS